MTSARTRPERFLSRRRFLGGAAVVFPLPAFLSWPRAARAGRRERREPARRLLVYHVPNGFHRASFTPRGDGTSFELSATLAPLADLRRDLLLPRGIANTVAVPIPQGGSHAAGLAALLTATRPHLDRVRVGVSFDQVVAGAVGHLTPLPSLQLGIDTTEGAQEKTWPLVYARTLSWAAPASPLPSITSPARAFERLFMGFDPRASRADIERRRARRTSLLDAVHASARDLAAALAADERPKLDEYMSSVRELERRLQAVRPAPRARLGRALSDETADFPTRLRDFQDLMVLAFRLDATRVITFSGGNALSSRPWPHLGVGNGHSETHHAGDAAKIENVKKMDLWRVERLAELLRALKTARDPDGRTLLESSVVLYLSEINDGHRHDQMDKPMVIAGQLGGFIRTGRVLYTSRPTGPDDTFADCSERTRTARTPEPEGCVGAAQLGDLYLGLLGAFGVPAERFGETGTRPLDVG